jgi:GntR family transcriptional regulator
MSPITARSGTLFDDFDATRRQTRRDRKSLKDQGEAHMTRPEPASRRIAAELREQITSGDLGPGAPLPSEPELAAARGVSRQTARTALQILEQEGLVTTRPRRGRIVRSRQRLKWNLSTFESPESTASATAWGTDVENQGHDPSGESLHIERIRPPADVAALLNLDPATDTCVVRRHVRYIDGRPATISDDYFDLRLVEGTELAAPEDTTREDILKEAGYEQTYDVDEIITRMPTPDEIDRLAIQPGTRRVTPPHRLHRRGPSGPPDNLRHPRRHHRPPLRRRHLTSIGYVVAT